MINDYEKAQQAIDRHAVTQDHATRRAMKEIAKWCGGVELSTTGEDEASGIVYFSIPVKVDDKHVGYAEVHIHAYAADEKPNVDAEFKALPVREEI